MQKLQLKRHHIGTLYLWRKKKVRFRRLFIEDGHTPETFAYFQAFFEKIVKSPPQTLVQITALPDELCNNCNKHAELGCDFILDSDYWGEMKINKDTITAIRPADVLGIKIGDTLTVEELLRKLDVFDKIKKSLPKALDKCIKKGLAVDKCERTGLLSVYLEDIREILGLV